MPDLILVTGSTDGLGLAAARQLVEDGNRVILHARNTDRSARATAALPEAESVVVADFTSLADVRRMADVLEGERLDAVIHNAGVGYREPRRIETVDGHSHVLQVNVLAPYLLSTLLDRPARTIWLSSGLHRSGDTRLDDVDWKSRPWDGFQAYSDSKLFDATLSAAMARRFPDAISNALEPGWVATKMGGVGAPDDLALGHVTQVWLAEATDPAARVSGEYFFHRATAETHEAVYDTRFQDELCSVLDDLLAR